MDLNITRKCLDLLLHLVVPEQKLLALLGLVLKLRGQLLVLKNGEPRRRLELLIVHSHQVCLGLLDLQEHLLS